MLSSKEAPKAMTSTPQSMSEEEFFVGQDFISTNRVIVAKVSISQLAAMTYCERMAEEYRRILGIIAVEE